MSLLRRRSPGRSCRIHDDNGCEIQGEAGTRERAQDKREWRADVDVETDRHTCRVVRTWGWPMGACLYCGKPAPPRPSAWRSPGINPYRRPR